MLSHDRAALPAALEHSQQTPSSQFSAKIRLHPRFDELVRVSHPLSVQEKLRQVPTWQDHCAATAAFDSSALLGKSAEIILAGGNRLNRTPQRAMGTVDCHDDLSDAAQKYFVFLPQSNLPLPAPAVAPSQVGNLQALCCGVALQ